MKREKELYKKALEYWGKDFQLDIIIEKCLELCHIILKYKRGKATYEDIIKEGVDVSIMLKQLEYITSINDIRIPSLWFSEYIDRLDRLEIILQNQK